MDDFGYIDGIAQEERVREHSDDQKQALDAVRAFMQDASARQFVIGGVAGSGKSTLIPHVIDMVGTPYDGSSRNGNVAVCAYTGKAVMNLKRKGVVNAMTLHSFLYETRYVDDETVPGGRKVVYIPKQDFMFREIALLIVDEASMVSREMHGMIESLPFRTLYIGDHFQLPPVGDSFNIMAKPDFRLERIHRQEEGNPIVMLADMARHGKPLPLGTFGASKHTRTLDVASLSSYDEIIVWTNDLKDRVNDTVRAQRGFQKDVPQMDDKMIVRVNCKAKNVYNGQIVYLVNQPVLKRGSAWSVEFVDELAYNDPFIMAQTDSATKAIASIHLPKQELDKLRSMPSSLKTKENYWKFKKDNPYQVHLDWGYAITCHASQGTSWKNVAVLFEDRMKYALGAEETSRWIYTAITRAEESVTIYSGGFKDIG